MDLQLNSGPKEKLRLGVWFEFRVFVWKGLYSVMLFFLDSFFYLWVTFSSP